MRGVEGQLLGTLLAQVQQHGGVHHGNGVAAKPMAVLGREVFRSAAVVSLKAVLFLF